MNIRRLQLLLVLIGASLILSVSASGQPVIYVNHAASGTNDGTSWTDAYTYLQEGLQAAQSGDEVWVSAGIYRPDQGTHVTLGDREASFVIPSGVSLYGGFSGTEMERAQRDWEVNETVLSGDLLENDDDLLTLDNPLRLDNSYHIVRFVNESAAVAIDGFTLTEEWQMKYPSTSEAQLNYRTT